MNKFVIIFTLVLVAEYQAGLLEPYYYSIYKPGTVGVPNYQQLTTEKPGEGYHFYVEEGQEFLKQPNTLTNLEMQKRANLYNYIRSTYNGLPFVSCIAQKEAIVFNLYTKQYGKDVYFPLMLNQYGELIGLNDSPYNPAKSTKVYIHGWLQTGTPPPEPNAPSYAQLQHIVESALSEDVNLIMVDWSKYSRCGYEWTYQYVVPDLGSYTATMIKSLIKVGSKLTDIELKGNNLGAHIALSTKLILEDKEPKYLDHENLVEAVRSLVSEEDLKQSLFPFSSHVSHILRNPVHLPNRRIIGAELLEKDEELMKETFSSDRNAPMRPAQYSSTGSSGTDDHNDGIGNSNNEWRNVIRQLVHKTEPRSHFFPIPRPITTKKLY